MPCLTSEPIYPHLFTLLKRKFNVFIWSCHKVFVFWVGFGFKNAAQRFAAWRSGEFRGTYVRLSTIVY